MSVSPERKPTAVLLLGERGAVSDRARAHAEKLFDVRAAGVYPRRHGALDASVTAALHGGVEYLFNFLSPFVLPGELLRSVHRAAINFHPAPPEHPGVGSASYAIYERDAQFGATAHLMTEQVDGGPILRVARFPIRPDETCEMLFDRGIDAALTLFLQLLEEIARSGPLQPDGTAWARPARTRREFERWMTLDPAAGSDEVERKIRALDHSKYSGPFVEVGGRRFELSKGSLAQPAPSVPRRREKLPWWEPQMTGLEYEAVKKVIDANYLNEGDVAERFEAELARRLGVAHVVAATSGTAAIFLSLAAVGLRHGDEVIVPDLTFIATANAVTLAGATPVLADVDPATLNLDPAAFERAITPRTRAVVPVHVSGRGADMPAIMRIAEAHGIAVVEDAAEAFMSKHHGRQLGTFGIAGCFSFSPNKTITTGQGGAIATNDAAFAGRLRELKDQGRPVRGTGGDDVHPAIGFNFKFTNLQAAIGIVQLTKLDERLDRQRAIYRAYVKALAGVEGIRLPGFDVDHGEVPQWTDAIVDRRGDLDRYLAERGAGSRRFWFPIHTQAPYRRPDADFPAAAAVGPKALWLPSAFTFTDEELERVTTFVRGFATNAKSAALA